MKWNYLLSHRHYFDIPIFGSKVQLCARCSGAALGFLALLLALPLVSSAVAQISAGLLIVLSISLAIPAILDWITQTWGLRESTNPLRLLTGMGEGLGIAMIASGAIPKFVALSVISAIALTTVVIGLAKTGAHRRTIKSDTPRIHHKELLPI